MEPFSPDEDEEPKAVSHKSFREQIRTYPGLGLAIIGVLAGMLFCVAGYGLSQLLGMFGGENSQTLKNFILAVDLMVIPLLLLGVLLGGATRYVDRLRLASSYQTRLDQMHSRLNYREDLLRLVADHQQVAISIFDRHNRYWYVNKRAAENIGLSVLEIIGKPPSKVLNEMQAKHLEARLAQVRSGDKQMEFMDREEDPDGTVRFIQKQYRNVTPFAELTGCVLAREEDLTNLIVERERRETMLRQVISTLVAVVDRRDPYAAGHSSRVGRLSRALGNCMGLSSLQCETAEIAGSLMNFGKILVSRHILTKTTALTPEELHRVRESILVSADILSIIGFEGEVVPTLRQVLERYDGTGVPEGMKGDNILVTARIVAVANAFVALVSPRAHRDGLSLGDAVDRMMAEADSAYDMKVLSALSTYIDNNATNLEWLTTTRQG